MFCLISAGIIMKRLQHEMIHQQQLVLLSRNKRVFPRLSKATTKYGVYVWLSLA